MNRFKLSQGTQEIAAQPHMLDVNIKDNNIEFDRKAHELSLHRIGLTLEVSDKLAEHDAQYVAAAASLIGEKSPEVFEQNPDAEEVNFSIYLNPHQSVVGAVKRRHVIEGVDVANHLVLRHEVRNDELEQVKVMSREHGMRLLTSTTN